MHINSVLLTLILVLLSAVFVYEVNKDIRIEETAQLAEDCKGVKYHYNTMLNLSRSLNIDLNSIYPDRTMLEKCYNNGML